MDKTEIDASSRGSKGFRVKVPGLIEGTYEGQLLHTPGDPVFETIKTAFFNNSVLLMAFVDGPLDAADALWGEEFPLDVTGLWGAFYITNFSESRALEDVLMHDVRFSATLEDTTLTAPDYKTETIPAPTVAIGTNPRNTAPPLKS